MNLFSRKTISSRTLLVLLILLAASMFSVAASMAHRYFSNSVFTTHLIPTARFAELPANQPMPHDKLTNDLDYIIQERFATVAKAFGLSRVSPTFDYFSQFTLKDAETVNAIRSEQLSVGIYLARVVDIPEKPAISIVADQARHYLAAFDQPMEYGKKRLMFDANRAQWRSPIALDVQTISARLPEWEYVAPAVQPALAKFDSGENTYDFKTDSGWYGRARPIRAAAQCLKCHDDRYLFTRTGDIRSLDGVRPLQVGEAMAVVMYVFKKEAPISDPGPLIDLQLTKDPLSSKKIQ